MRFVGLLFPLALAFSLSTPVLAASGALAEHVPGELIVKLREAAPSKAEESLLVRALGSRLGGGAVTRARPFATDRSLELVTLGKDGLLEPAMAAFARGGSVEYVEPNYIYRDLSSGRADFPDDPDFSQCWSLRNSGSRDNGYQPGIAGDDLDILPLWKRGITGSRKVVVAVVDSGMQWDHPDLAPNLYTNPGEVAGNGVDDDRNGFVDDIHGWNFVNDTNDTRDDYGHGTHCSGIIGAVGDNGIGIAGVNWSVSLMPVKFIDANGAGTAAGAVESIRYATLMKANVINASWGGTGFSKAIHDAIDAARAQGILFVAAAGNDGKDNDTSGDPDYPGSYNLPNIISVAASDNRDDLAPFSNFGSRGGVQVAAPGAQIYSTYKGSSYTYLSGTSMAAPQVSGLAALILSGDPSLTFGQLKDRIIRTSARVRSLKGKVLAAGVINAFNAYYGIIPPDLEPPDGLWKTRPLLIESSHPYDPRMDQTYPVTVPGARYVRVHFAQIQTQRFYDIITIETPDGKVVDELSGDYWDYYSEYVKGDSLVIRFRTDPQIEFWGFKVDQVQSITGGWTPPSSGSSYPGPLRNSTGAGSRMDSITR